MLVARSRILSASRCRCTRGAVYIVTLSTRVHQNNLLALQQKTNKIDGNEQRKGGKAVVVDEKTCKSDVCVRENEWKVVKMATEKYPETENPPGRTWKHDPRGRDRLQLIVIGVQGRNIRFEALSYPDVLHQLLELASLIEG
jgi:hypothetical protein